MTEEKKDDTVEDVEVAAEGAEQSEVQEEAAKADAEKTEAAPAEEKKEEETKEEAPAAKDTAEEEGADVEVPEQFKALVEQVENMTVLELNELVKLLEKKFGVSASAVAVAGPGAGGDAGDEEKSDFVVHLASFGEKKIAVIKVVKEVLGLGLKDAKDMVESAPVDLKSAVKKDEAEEWKGKFEEAGATVELK